MNLLHRVILLLGCVVTLPAIAVQVIDLRRIEPVQGDAAAAKSKAGTLCVVCHGGDGVSPVPMFPNLAGQKADYLYHQLLRFKNGVLPESPMTVLAATLSEDELRNLAVYYAALAPATTAAPITDRAQFDRGATLYRDGDTAKGIPPCQGCHGTGAQGIAVGNAVQLAYPNLRYQHAQYLVTRLGDYRARKLNQTSNELVMQAVASRLDDDDIEALAAWIASAP